MGETSYAAERGVPSRKPKRASDGLMPRSNIGRAAAVSCEPLEGRRLLSGSLSVALPVDHIFVLYVAASPVASKEAAWFVDGKLWRVFSPNASPAASGNPRVEANPTGDVASASVDPQGGVGGSERWRLAVGDAPEPFKADSTDATPEDADVDLLIARGSVIALEVTRHAFRRALETGIDQPNPAATGSADSASDSDSATAVEQAPENCNSDGTEAPPTAAPLDVVNASAQSNPPASVAVTPALAHPRPARVIAEVSHASTQPPAAAAEAGSEIGALLVRALPTSTTHAGIGLPATEQPLASSRAGSLHAGVSTLSHTVLLTTAVESVRLARAVDSATLFSAVEISSSSAQAAVVAPWRIPEAAGAARQLATSLPRWAIEALRNAAAANATAAPVPLVGRVMYNLIHLDALGMFSDGTGRFITDSLSLGQQQSSSRSRAWLITSIVVAGDAALIGYLLRTRQDRQQQAEPQPPSPQRPGNRRRRPTSSPAMREFAAEI